MENFLKDRHRQELEAAYQTAKDKRIANKINVLLLSDDGYSQDEISKILRLNQSTITRYLQAYLANYNVAAYLESSYKGGVCQLTKQQFDELGNHLDAVLCGSTDEVLAYVKNKFNVTYSRSGMAALLKRNGFVFKKPILVPGKGDTELQEAFVAYYKQIKESMGPKDKMYFLDGVHPQHNTIAAGGWIRKGKEKHLKSNTGRKRINLNGALDVDTHELIIREDETINAQSTIELLKMIEKENTSANKIALIIDNAAYYYNSEVIGYAQDSPQLELIYLPVYSPNLNLIERVWRFMKKKVLYNQFYETFAQFKAAVGDFFQELPKYQDELNELLTEDFHITYN